MHFIFTRFLTIESRLDKIEKNLLSLENTEQVWEKNGDGTSTFDSPIETGNMLDAEQGKVPGFGGTCGLVSCVNVLRMAGIEATEQQVVNFAASNGICWTGDSEPGNNGGTDPSDRREVLAYFGVKSELRESTIENISTAVSEGRGVIASVDAGKLWGDPDYFGGSHAVTITSVKRDDSSGEVTGFDVCDSGTGGKDQATYYSASHIENALTGRPINVTSIIR